jgi:hypothetical protein
MKTKSTKRKEAEARQALRDKRTAREQIAVLRQRTGSSEKECVRLRKGLKYEVKKMA